MYRDGWISYNPDDLTKAVSESKKVSDMADSFKSKYSGIEDLIPQNFKFSGELLTVLRDIISGDLSYNKISEVERFLITTKNELDKHTEQNKVSEQIMNYGYNITEINGRKGYLYIPEGYTSTANLPLVTWFAGSGEVSQRAMNEKGLSHLISQGYKMDAVVWCPINYQQYSHDEQYNVIKSIVKDYNLDEERVSLVGFSLGAHKSYDMARVHPNYFSSIVTYGTCYVPHEIDSPDTTFIMFQGQKDQYSDASNTYNRLVEHGNQTLLYKLNGAYHTDINTIFSEELVSDITNIKRGNKLINEVNSIIEVETKYENGKRVIDDNNYYIKLSNRSNNKNNNIDNKLEVPEFNIEHESTQTQPSTPSVSTKPSTPIVPTQPSTPSNSTKPSTPSVPTQPSTPSVSTKTSTTLVKNIFPDNKFSDVLPNLQHGKLNSMEISKSMVNYNVGNISESNYNEYIKLLEKNGYTLTDGKWVNNDYEIVVDYTDKDLNIYLKTK